jgi:hypothetical protein
LCWVQRTRGRTERTKKRRMKKKKTMKHKLDKFSFFNLFRSFSVPNTPLDFSDPHEEFMSVKSESNKTEI